MAKTYIVRSGDTLSGIAGLYGLTLTELLGVNPAIPDPDTIQVGQEIALPDEAEAPLSPHLSAVLGSGFPWFEIAKREEATGVHELSGQAHNPRILEYLQSTTLDADAASRDETHWCSAFVNWCMEQAGISGTNSALALSWLNWQDGVKLSQPRPGCVAVFVREGGGHVGFYYGPKDHNTIFLLGGNQSDAVNVKSYPLAGLRGYRWPKVGQAAPPPATAAAPGRPAPSGPAAMMAQYQRLFDTCRIHADKLAEIDAIIDIFMANIKKYQEVGVPLGVPWYFIACIQSLEGPLDFTRHLHNGDPLTARTVRVPKGRPPEGEPPFSWKGSAIDALTYMGYVGISNWTLPLMLHNLEKFNGMGYRNRGINSPYLWSYSDQYTKGKYVADHKFDPEAVSKQVGVAVLIKRMAERHLIKLPGEGAAPEVIAAETLTPTPPVVPEPGGKPRITFSASEKSEGARELQRFLNIYVDAEVQDDGIPGDATSDAFYRVTGYWLPGDPREEEPVITHSTEECSDAAEDLQKWLNTFEGIDIEVDGYPGDETSLAFKQVTGHYLYGDPREDEEEA